MVDECELKSTNRGVKLTSEMILSNGVSVHLDKTVETLPEAWEQVLIYEMFSIIEHQFRVEEMNDELFFEIGENGEYADFVIQSEELQRFSDCTDEEWEDMTNSQVEKLACDFLLDLAKNYKSFRASYKEDMKVVRVIFTSPLNASFNREEVLQIDELVKNPQDWSTMDDMDKFMALREPVYDIIAENFIHWRFVEE